MKLNRIGGLGTNAKCRICGPGSNPGVDTVSGLSLLLVLSGYSGFPLSPKTNVFQFQFDQESGRRRTTLWMCYLQIIIYYYLFIYIFHIDITRFVTLLVCQSFRLL